MLGYQSPQFLQALGADKIIDDGNGTMYVCTLDASKLDRSATAAAIENQPIWNIKRVQETTASGVTTTTIMFPNGRNTFDSIVANYASLTYSYAK